MHTTFYLCSTNRDTEEHEKIGTRGHGKQDTALLALRPIPATLCLVFLLHAENPAGIRIPPPKSPASRHNSDWKAPAWPNLAFKPRSELFLQVPVLMLAFIILLNSVLFNTVIKLSSLKTTDNGFRWVNCSKSLRWLNGNKEITWDALSNFKMQTFHYFGKSHVLPLLFPQCIAQVNDKMRSYCNSCNTMDPHLQVTNWFVEQTTILILVMKKNEKNKRLQFSVRHLIKAIISRLHSMVLLNADFSQLNQRLINRKSASTCKSCNL